MVGEIEVRLFGRLADAFGRTRPIQCDQAGLTVTEIRERLGGEILDRSRVKAVIGDVIVSDDATVTSGSSVEFLPPLSGG